MLWAEDGIVPHGACGQGWGLGTCLSSLEWGKSPSEVGQGSGTCCDTLSQHLTQATVHSLGVTPVVVVGKSQVRTGDSKFLAPQAAPELHGPLAECRNLPPMLLGLFSFGLEESSALVSQGIEVGHLFAEWWQGYCVLLWHTGWGQCSWTAQGVVPISIPRSGSEMLPSLFLKEPPEL